MSFMITRALAHAVHECSGTLNIMIADQSHSQVMYARECLGVNIKHGGQPVLPFCFVRASIASLGVLESVRVTVVTLHSLG